MIRYWSSTAPEVGRSLCSATEWLKIVLRNGWAGVVANGVIRDSEEIDAMEIGVKALGTAPNRPSLAGEGTSDITVTFGGVSFIPSRRLVADRDGVVVLPEGCLTEADIPVADAIAADRADLKRRGTLPPIAGRQSATLMQLYGRSATA
jgi:regulator of RNase E activity RraA